VAAERMDRNDAPGAVRARLDGVVASSSAGRPVTQATPPKAFWARWRPPVGSARYATRDTSCSP
jgi:hypothetical protein